MTNRTNPPIVSVVPWGRCLAGLGAASPQPFTQPELATIRKSKVEAFKVLTLGDAGETRTMIDQLRAIRSDMLIVARLFFSVGSTSRTPFMPLDFADCVRNGFEACHAAGVKYVEVHNEPNLAKEGNHWNWRDGAEFGGWLSQTLTILKMRHPDMLFGYPGLSPQPDLSLFLSQSAFAVERCDWIGAHSYWWNPAGVQPWPMDDVNGGQSWRIVRDRFPHKLVMLTEFSCNTPDVPAKTKGEQYAQYYQSLRDEPNMGAAFAFALSWPDQDENREGWRTGRGETEIAAIVGATL